MRVAYFLRTNGHPLWDVELTDRGLSNQDKDKKEKYGHTHKGDCSYWQSDIQLSKVHHWEVTGIVEIGPLAKVDITLYYTLTPTGKEIKRTAPIVIARLDQEDYGKQNAEFRKRFGRNAWSQVEIDERIHRDVDYVIGEELLGSEEGYTKHTTAQFQKYDDGWKLTEFENGIRIQR